MGREEIMAFELAIGSYYAMTQNELKTPDFDYRVGQSASTNFTISRQTLLKAITLSRRIKTLLHR
jgi:hypothetical protein